MISRSPGRPRPILRWLLLCGAVLALGPVQAHELGLSLWRLTPLGPSATATDWTLQAELPRQSMQQPIWLDAGEDCQSWPQGRSLSAEVLWLDWSIRCTRPWDGRRIHLRGLNPRLPDALLEVSLAHGPAQVYRLDHQQPALELQLTAAEPGWAHFFVLGLDHLATGWDHLILIALLALGYRWRQSASRLVGLITGFTVAHSLSLLLVLGWDLHLPMAPVEALIALSLALLAADHLRHLRSDAARGERPPGQTLRLACGFGLVHGLGFADALRAIGLPSEQRWPALLMFNLGLEAAQLLWLALLLLLAGLLRGRPTAQALRLGLYTIGALSSSWFLARLSAL